MNRPHEDSIADVLRGPWGRFFQCARTNGVYRLADPDSHFNNAAAPEKLTYDISNNAMLAIHGANGELKAVTCYRDTYYTLTSMWPGVWTAKDNSTYGPFSFMLEMDGQKHDLARVDWDLRTGLLDNTIPVSEFDGPEQRFIARVITFAPVSADGSRRVRCVVHGLQLENTSSSALKATIRLPLSANNKPFETFAQSDGVGRFDVWLGDAPGYSDRITVELAPGGTAWVPAIIAMPGDGAPETIHARGTLAWLKETQTFYRRLVGRLSIPEQPFLAEFYERMFLQTLQAIGQTGGGRIAGSNLGTVPPTRLIWGKDFFYSALPHMAGDPAFAEKLIEWFDTYGIRPAGTTDRTDHPSDGNAGGVTHSLSVSVAAPLLAGLLYEQTGETAVFRRHPEWKAHWADVFGELVETRPDPNVWLFPSRYISDGEIHGDYHTGSNVAMWRALAGYARLLDEVWNDCAAAGNYREMAERVKQDILARTVIDGPLGRQFIEAVNRDGTVPSMESDGEESETTLMPYYGFLSYDDPVYLNTMRFAVSSDNTAYRPAYHSISWNKDVVSTAPGYNKGLCAWSEADDLFGDHGACTEVRRLADGDGVLWWWAYGARDATRYGVPIRAHFDVGKSGWAAGVYSAVFLSRFAGVSYDAPTSSLKFVPLPVLGDLAWIDLPMGHRRFSLSCAYDSDSVIATVDNPNDHAVTLRTILTAPGPAPRVSLNGKEFGGFEQRTLFGHRAVELTCLIPANDTAKVEIRQGGPVANGRRLGCGSKSECTARRESGVGAVAQAVQAGGGLQ